MSKYRVVAAAAVLALLAVLSPTAVSGASSVAGGGVEMIVVLHESYAPGGHEANRARAGEVARSHGLAPTHTYGTALFGFSATVPEGRLAGLERDRRVAFVQENRTLHALDYPKGVKRIDGDDVHGLTTGRLTGAGIKVAVLDTGIDADHVDLVPNLGVGKNCLTGSEGAGTDDDHGHGTHVAGTIGATFDSTVTGVAPDVDLIPVKVLDSSGSGDWDEVICGIDFVAEQRIPVANMSLGARGSFDGMICGSATDALFVALCNAIGVGSTFTVAAGNDGVDASGFVPAAHPDVITVSAFSDTDGVANGSTTCSGRGLWKTCDESFASFSNYGAIVDVIAPGVNITSTTYDGKTGTKSGTSMAAPHVAGVVALLLERTPGMTPAEVAAHLRATGQCPDTNENPGTGDCTGSWHNDPDGIAEPMANALFAAQGSSGGDDGGTTGNSAPVADDDSATVIVGGDVVVNVLEGDSDPDGDVLTVTIAEQGTAGTATVNEDKTVTYTHTGSSTGSDSFTYTVTDPSGASDTARVSITITSSTTGDITLTATGYKVKGLHHVDLTWSGAGSTDVDVVRDGAPIDTTANDGAYTDAINRKGGGSYTYKVCEAGTTTCSNEVTVTF